ncbi:Bug family tripartite tricarboxylate transporter substrate binding protein [Plastoroseomonas hellenica]|uniref:Bug family tripartite tricarboxylate transporter substrate binding protein n=1 Tax=Plastoroseomonas hellenica TaxID=2687306 RepID=UPI001BA4A724|nr:tripartite tricarboxylate transporter substrate-binding protein [Plastoroseomonas hellenica]MBR0643855.1 tripartite tricarboxylate transporter substrate binding protein [Plastoroseomonas hellenica]
MLRRCLLALCLGAALPQAAEAQRFPDRPVRLVIPYPAGGSLDVVGRAVGQRFQELSGQPLVLDNRGGASGVIAADHVAKSRPDGTTLILASAPQLSIASALQPNLPYDPRVDLVPITWLVSTPFALFTAAQFAPRDLAGVLAAGRANPGRIAFGSPGNGSLGHLALAMFAQATGTDWLHVPYRGAAQVMNDMAAGMISLSFTTIASARPMVEGGQLRPIAIAAAARSPALPDMPTFAELGLPQVEVPLWLGVMAPRGTPAAIIDRLNALFLEAMADPGVQRSMAAAGATVAAEGPARFSELLEADFPRWGEVIRRGDITLN